MDCVLKKLSVHDGHDIYEMLQKIPRDENGFINSINGASFDDYKRWLITNDLQSQKTEIEDGWKVPQSVFWLYVDKKPVGFGKVRHFLTEKLLLEGGTLGYAIIPEERNKGYGTVLLRELLIESNRLKIDKVLLTIRNNNIPSIKVALANGGEIKKTDEERHFIWIEHRGDGRFVSNAQH